MTSLLILTCVQHVHQVHLDAIMGIVLGSHLFAMVGTTVLTTQTSLKIPTCVQHAMMDILGAIMVDALLTIWFVMEMITVEIIVTKCWNLKNVQLVNLISLDVQTGDVNL